jgi:magnesium transporter
VLGAQRDVFDRSVPDLIRTPSLGPGAAAYLRDVQDHLHRLTDRADAERDRLTGLVHLSEDMTNTRLAAASERFALIATIFLPLTAVSSFFGMNFSWMVERLDSLGWFLALGIGLPTLLLAAIVLIIVRRGWSR